jgi:hypothetical protein
MRQNRRFGGINLLAAIAASIFLLPVLGSGVVNAQRRVADDSDVFKGDRPAREPGSVVAQRGTQIRRLLPGAPAPGIVRSDAPPSTSALLAAPISSCANNPGPQPASGHTCNVYESDAAGNPSEISNVITIPNVVVGGYLVLKEDGNIADSVVTNWSDVLKFGDGSNNNTTTMQLFSKGCNTGNPNDTSCFPAYSPGTSGFIVEAHPGPTVFFNSPNTYNIYSIDDDAPVRPWTTAASTGQVDEDSTSLVRFNSFGVNLATGQTGSVNIRYNITAVEGISKLCPATHSTIRTRFRNSDNSGVQAKVTYELRTSSINNGGNTVLYTFNSNGRGAGAGFTTVTDTTAIDFDFATNMYWIEANLFRSDPNVFADLGTIQIWESAGTTSCP